MQNIPMPYHLKEKVIEASKAGYHQFEIGNIWGLQVIPKESDISADSSFYMMNTEAIQQAKEWEIKRITLPIEDTLENLETVSEKAALPCVLTLYQDVPLFQSVNCLTRHCAVCQKRECRMRLTKDNQIYHVGLPPLGLFPPRNRCCNITPNGAALWRVLVPPICGST